MGIPEEQDRRIPAVGVFLGTLKSITLMFNHRCPGQETFLTQPKTQTGSRKRIANTQGVDSCRYLVVSEDLSIRDCLRKYFFTRCELEPIRPFVVLWKQ